MKMKKAKWLEGLVLAGIIALMLTGCATPQKPAKGSFFVDYGIYDQSVPENEQAELRFLGIRFKTFNGEKVKWGGSLIGEENGYVRIPAGTHDLFFDWYYEMIEFDMVTRKQKQTIKRVDGIFMSYEFKPGHKYLLSCTDMQDGTVTTTLLDITYTPNEFYGDIIPDAPKAAAAATVFEGEWEWSGPNANSVYKFAGNTWESTTLVVIPEKNTKSEQKAKGTFDITDRLNLYYTDTMLISDNKALSSISGKWRPITSKQAIYYTYTFEEGNLLLEMEGHPSYLFTKR
jgi:hypothetical protein